ncbi:MAG: hypothetical protein EPN57_03310 [Paraburkholderia sp.]|nr:MAG: hypothetical protein EPN57_03310 [Paraburkholderia sp.]
MTGRYASVPMLYIRIGVALSLLACQGVSNAVDCQKLSDLASRDGIFVPRDDAGRTVIGKGRLQFYSAPDYSCVMRGVFVIKGQTVNAYTEYRKFTSVVYLSDKREKPIVGWVRTNRLTPNGIGVAPAQK